MKKNSALEADASFKKLLTTNNENIYAFIRQKNADKVLVIVNLSNKKQEFKLEDTAVNGIAADDFSLQKETISNTQSMQLDAWAYKVYSY